MPYKLEKNKDKSFKLINKQTGHILAEHTTPERAMKQVKAIHAHKGSVANKYAKSKDSMPAHHRIRKNVELLQHRHITNPKHKQFIELTKKLLKHEEMHGSGFWDDVWDFTKDVLNFPFDVIENIPFVKPAVQMGLTAVGLAPVAMLLDPAIAFRHEIFGNTNQGMREVWNPDSIPKDTNNYDYNYNYNNGYNIPPPPLEPTKPTVAEVIGPTVQEIFDKSNLPSTRSFTAKEQILNPYGEGNEAVMYNPLAHLVPSANLAFPPTMHFDPRDQPQGLVDFLNRKSVGAVNVSQHEYDAIVNKQKPQLWLSFPQNGYFKKYPSYQTGIN
jgi:hypothetical protein